MLKKLLFIVAAFGYLMGLEIIPEDLKITYCNPKYFRDFNFSVHKYDPHGPYYWNYKAENIVEMGNNVMNHVEVSILGDDGKYHPTPLKISSKSCDFLAEDHIIGKMIAQLIAQNNYKCPFAPGKYEINNFTLNLDHIPEIGLLSDNRKFKLRSVYEAYIITDQKDPLLNIEMQVTVQPNKK